MAQPRGVFSTLYDNIDKTISGILRTSLKEIQPIWRNLFNVESSDRKFERTMTMAPFGDVPEKPEGNVYSLDLIRPAHTKDFTHTEFGMGFEVTEVQVGFSKPNCMHQMALPMIVSAGLVSLMETLQSLEQPVMMIMVRMQEQRMSSSALGLCGPFNRSSSQAMEPTGDSFGYSISLSGDTAVIGSPFDDDVGAYTGSAYVCVRSGSVWTQQAKILPSGAAAGDYIGDAVFISGDTLLVGAPYDNDHGVGSGSAYVLTRSGTTWTQQGANATATDAIAATQRANATATSIAHNLELDRYD